MGTNPGCALVSKNNHQMDNINKNLSNPGQYDPNFSLVKPRPQSCKFSSSNRMPDKATQGPSPGQYEPSFSQVLKRDPTTKIKEDYNKERKIESAGLPGPGYYETNKSTLNKTAFSLGMKLEK